jgi:hypothetical protein
METDPHVVPSKWVCIVVHYGEKKKHLYSGIDDGTPTFFASEGEAEKWAFDHCRYDQKATVLICRADRLVVAKPVEFDSIKAA